MSRIVIATEQANDGSTNETSQKIVDLELLEPGNPYRVAIEAALKDERHSAEIDCDELDTPAVDAAVATLPAMVIATVDLFWN